MCAVKMEGSQVLRMQTSYNYSIFNSISKKKKSNHFGTEKNECESNAIKATLLDKWLIFLCNISFIQEKMKNVFRVVF